MRGRLLIAPLSHRLSRRIISGVNCRWFPALEYDHPDWATVAKRKPRCRRATNDPTRKRVRHNWLRAHDLNLRQGPLLRARSPDLLRIDLIAFSIPF